MAVSAPCSHCGARVGESCISAAGTDVAAHAVRCARVEARLIATRLCQQKPGRAWGQRHGRAKLRIDDVVHIRASQVDAATRTALAARYGIAVSTVKEIQRRRTWKRLQVAA